MEIKYCIICKNWYIGDYCSNGCIKLNIMDKYASGILENQIDLEPTISEIVNRNWNKLLK